MNKFCIGRPGRKLSIGAGVTATATATATATSSYQKQLLRTSTIINIRSRKSIKQIQPKSPIAMIETVLKTARGAPSIDAIFKH